MTFIARIGTLVTISVLSLGRLASAEPPAGDVTFMAKASQGNMAELQMVDVAMRRSHNTIVIAFYRQMRADHTKNESLLHALANKEGVTLPSDVDAAAKAMLASLGNLSSANFNRGYLQAQVTAHTQMLALIKSEIANGKDPQVVAFAKMTLPVVQQHLALAQKDLATPAAMPNPM